METIPCTPFCAEDCAFSGQHNNLILSMVGLQESKEASLREWKASIISAKEMCDFNQPLQDPDPDLHYPLLHWAATLGKVKAVKWLLEQDFISFKKTPLTCNLSNLTVVFSMVRYLHEGVKTRETHLVCKIFVSILDVLLKHDPEVLLVQEGENNDTVLHLCAREEGGSTAPFLIYLKRILGKLQEVSEKNKRLPLSAILERKNGKGDTFLHVLAKRNNKEEARELVNFAKGKFYGESFLIIENTEGKTADKILNEMNPDPEPSQKHQPSNASVRPVVSCKSRPVLDNDSSTAKALPVLKPGQISLSQCNTEMVPDSQSDGEIHDKEKRTLTISEETHKFPKADKRFPSTIENPPYSLTSHEEIPPLVFEDLVTDGMIFDSTSSNLHHLEDDNDHSHLVGEPNEDPAKDCHDAEIDTPVQSKTSVCVTEAVSNSNTLCEAKDGVKKLIQETERELVQDTGALEEARRFVAECEEKMKRLREEKHEKEAEVRRLEETVKAKENKLNGYKESLGMLV